MNIVQQASLRAAPRSHTKGDFAREEVGLANRNSGLPLEALRYDVTPVGLHFLLTHFDVPFVASPEDWRLAVGGRRPQSAQPLARTDPEAADKDVARDARMRRKWPRQC